MSVANLGAVSPSNCERRRRRGPLRPGRQLGFPGLEHGRHPGARADRHDRPLQGLGDPCGGTSFNAVDTVIRYDELAGRWILVFVPYDFGFIPPYHLCVAVSASSDPAGAWNGYDFDAGSNLPTGLRLGVWPTATS